jgi:uncharacterized NAD-dependent epimerase/dehydratase family protein
MAVHGLIYVYEIGRQQVTGVSHVKIPSHETLLRLYHELSNVNSTCRLLGIAMNSRRVSAKEAAEERDRMRAEHGLPVCDVIRDGPDELLDAVVAFRDRGEWRNWSLSP